MQRSFVPRTHSPTHPLFRGSSLLPNTCAVRRRIRISSLSPRDQPLRLSQSSPAAPHPLGRFPAGRRPQQRRALPLCGGRGLRCGGSGSGRRPYAAGAEGGASQPPASPHPATPTDWNRTRAPHGRPLPPLRRRPSRPAGTPDRRPPQQPRPSRHPLTPPRRHAPPPSRAAPPPTIARSWRGTRAWRTRRQEVAGRRRAPHRCTDAVGGAPHGRFPPLAARLFGRPLGRGRWLPAWTVCPWRAGHDPPWCGRRRRRLGGRRQPLSEPGVGSMTGGGDVPRQLWG